ncbi:MAG: WecB/TagA/CpsF family glycosyltransferase [Pseudomonadota bacterium]
MQRLCLGRIHADMVTFEGAITAIAELIQRGQGGYVVTPNVDHVVLAESDAELRAAYDDASLSLVDGMPLVWLSRLVGARFPEKVSGSDLALPLLERAAREGWRVFFLGAAPGVGARAAEVVQAMLPTLQIVGLDAPPRGFECDPVASAEALERVRASRPDLVLVALGCPLQELLMHRWRAARHRPWPWAWAGPWTSWRASSDARRPGCRASGSSGATACGRTRGAWHSATWCAIARSWALPGACCVRRAAPCSSTTGGSL